MAHCVDADATWQISLEALQGFHGSIQADVFDVLTLEGSVAARDHFGGTAPRVRAAAEAARKALANRSSHIE